MINLLPPDIKENMSYARKNTILLRWIIAFVIALIGVGLIIAGGQLYLRNAIKTTTTQVDQEKQSLRDQKIDEAQNRLEEISSDTKLILQVLSREILFSKLLQQLGASTPPDTSLQSFQVDELQGGLTLMALAKDINSATQLQINLEDPNNQIFEKADIESINCANDDPNSTYSCTVQIRALFAKNNPFVYINPTDVSGIIGGSQ